METTKRLIEELKQRGIDGFAIDEHTIECHNRLVMADGSKYVEVETILATDKAVRAYLGL